MPESGAGAELVGGVVEAGLVEEGGGFVEKGGVEGTFPILGVVFAEEAGEFVGGGETSVEAGAVGVEFVPAFALFGIGEHFGPELVGVEAEVVGRAFGWFFGK